MEIQILREICYLSNCNSLATEIIEVSAEPFDPITINVCKKCVVDFKEEDLN